MIAFRGRHAALQYMPQKPCKRGLKLFALCDSITGYLHRMEIYLGKKSPNINASSNGIYFDIVDRLTKHLQGKYHRVIFDNLYTSIPLLLHLLQNKTYAIGTIRMNRKFTPDKTWPGKLVRGDWRVSEHTSLICFGFCFHFCFDLYSLVVY